jgi:transcription elongation factor GreA
MNEITYVMPDGLERMKQELHEMKTKGRQEMAHAIAEARDKGDLKENAEYDAAKEAQGLLELKISKLETLIANARLIDESQFDNTRVFIMSKVKVKNVATKATFTYTLVSEKEANLKEFRISVDSPVGKGLLGKAIGEIAEIKVPAGSMQLEVLEISR